MTQWKTLYAVWRWNVLKPKIHIFTYPIQATSIAQKNLQSLSVAVLISRSILTSSEGSVKATNIYIHKISPSWDNITTGHTALTSPSTLPSWTLASIPPQVKKEGIANIHHISGVWQVTGGGKAAVPKSWLFPWAVKTATYKSSTFSDKCYTENSM